MKRHITFSNSNDNVKSLVLRIIDKLALLEF